MAGGLTLKFRDKEFNRQLQKASAVGLQRAAAYLHTKCRQEVSRPNTATRRKRTRDTSSQGGGAAGSQYSTFDNSSAPGAPPHLRTGFGRSQIVWEYNGNPRDPVIRVGVGRAGLYMIFLELGTRTTKPRPWLLATLMKYKSVIGKLAAIGGKSEIGR